MFQSLDLFVLSFLFVVVEPQDGQVWTEKNVSLQWISGFQPQLSWAPMGCTYEGAIMNIKEERSETISQSPWEPYFRMEGGSVKLVVSECNGTAIESEFNISNPELVSKLQCYVYASQKMNCSWLPSHQATNLRFFFRLPNNEKSTTAQLKDSIRECPVYIYTDGITTGCHLKLGVFDVIDILFNGTVNNKIAWNTFKRPPSGVIQQVKLPALHVTVTKNNDKYNVSWIHPDIQVRWQFIINYTECKPREPEVAPNGSTFKELNVDPKCRSCIAVKAETETKTSSGTPIGQTPWSELKCFDAESDPQPYVYAAIIIPLVFAGLAVLGFVCCRKNKENIFPKVPKPRDLISDIYDNNNKCNVPNLYVPAEEEDNCKIMLVVDPQINNGLVATT